ncbi:MAG: DUF459 domain-containing protein [Rhodomicrobium sp.]|nr:DUF459 domain-containing protein [Rhodomicrobium sp.]
MRGMCGANAEAAEGEAFPARLTSAVCALISVILTIAGAHAQGTNLLSSSYITPFPQTERYELRVIGDWLGAGLTAGLQEAFKGDGSLEIADMSRSNYGLARVDRTDLNAQVDRMLSGTPVHIVIIMLGVNDRASLKTPTGRAQPGSEEWKDVYGKEAEKLTKKLRNANVAVYWVGLPVMGNAAFNEAVAAMNDAVRESAYTSGAKFIEASVGFTDQAGAYSAYGPDLTGQTKRLREADGIGLTAAGNRKLANYVEIALRRDLARARAQRNIPLAGDEEEQARVVPGRSRNAAPAKSAAGPSTPASASKQPPLANDKTGPSAKNATGAGTAPSALPAAQDAARRDQAAFAGGGGQQGEYILSDLGNGLTSIAVISPVSEFSIREILRQTPLADRLYFKVLSKGEALPPKEGRADDFRWRGDQAPQSQ